MIRINNNEDNVIYIPRTAYCSLDVLRLRIYGIGEEEFVIDPESVKLLEYFYRITILKNSFPHDGEFKYRVEHSNVLESKTIESGLIFVGDLTDNVKMITRDKDRYKQYDENNYIEFDG